MIISFEIVVLLVIIIVEIWNYGPVVEDIRIWTYNNDNDVIQNYDKIMLFESPITFQIDEPNRVAKKLLISVQKENN